MSLPPTTFLRRLKDLVQFRWDIRISSENLVGSLADDWVGAEVGDETIDWIGPMRLLSVCRSRGASWFSEFLREMKHQKECLEHSYRR